MTEGDNGFLLSVALLKALWPQLLLALTERVPEVNEALTVRVILFVPWPLEMVVFVGADQV